ncbi:MAG TPA: AP2 domain-containing protein [Nitrospiraceae bacterium]|nr:AP2 domain-containing protein [Nitrospiraceae bacterium]
MADTCYSRGKKVILVPGQKDNGRWVCRFTIPEFKESEIGKYQGHPPGEYETEQEAKMAAFEYAKKVLDSSN